MKSTEYAVFRYGFWTAAVVTVLAVLVDAYRDNWSLSWDTLDAITIVIAVVSFSVPVLAQLMVQVLLSELPERVDARHVQRLAPLIEEMHDLGDIRSRFDRLQHELARGVVDYEKRRYRALEYDEQKGSLLNRFEDDDNHTRNVLFSNKTINLIFTEVEKLHRGALPAIGEAASRRFARELVESIQDSFRRHSPDPLKIDLLEWISLWLQFDTAAGFGRFTLNGKRAKAAEMTLEEREQWKSDPRLILHYSFLVDDDAAKEARLCGFMTGYIKGVLDNFPEPVLAQYGLQPHGVSVEHHMGDGNQCVCAGRHPADGCIFRLVSDG